MSMASTMCRHPSCPIAPPIRVPSVQKAITFDPSIRPRTAHTPEVSVACNPDQRALVQQRGQPHLRLTGVDGARVPGGVLDGDARGSVTAALISDDGAGR